ncbi:MAG: S-layer family protein, partial [Clostridia bacterium]|nr:S-layer family protein [Clostridia bacterium]
MKKNFVKYFVLYLIISSFFSGCKGVLQRELPEANPMLTPTLTLSSSVSNGIKVFHPDGRIDSYKNFTSLKNGLDSNGAIYQLTTNQTVTESFIIDKDVTVTLDLNGFVLTLRTANTFLTNNGNLTITDSRPSSLHKYNKGANGIYVWNDREGTLERTGGAIVGSSANPRNQTGLVIENNGVFTLESGNIMGSVSLTDKSVIVNSGVAYIKGGLIEGNTSSKGCGGIYNTKDLYISGGLIQNNMSGKGVGCNIESNGENGPANVTMTGGAIISAKSPSVRITGSQSVLTMQDGGILGGLARYAAGTITIHGGYFDEIPEGDFISATSARIPNDGGNPLYPADKYLVRIVPPTQENGKIEITYSYGDSISVEAANFSDELFVDGATYKLSGNIGLTNNLTVPAGVSIVLDLNGFVLKGTGNGSVITNNGNLTIDDSDSDSQHKYTKGSDGLYTWDDANGTITITGGAIIGGKVLEAEIGGGITNNGNLTLRKGSIVGNFSSENGGGIYNNERLIMEGGRIEGNRSEKGGGGIYSNNRLTIVDVLIKDNVSGTNTANNIELDSLGQSSDCTMVGGTICGTEGTSVLVSGSLSTFTITGGGIDGEIVPISQGKIAVSGGYFGQKPDTAWIGKNYGLESNTGDNSIFPTNKYPYMVTQSESRDIFVTYADGTTGYISVEDFAALDKSGAAYQLLQDLQLTTDLTVPSGITVTLDLNGFILKGTGKNSVITNNGNLTIIDSNPTAPHKYSENGYGLYIRNDSSGTNTLPGGAILGGNGVTGGGINNCGLLNLQAGNIVGNTANSGGGVYNSGTFNMDGGKIVGNRATNNGGGVNTVGESITNIRNGDIIDNTAEKDGGGVNNEKGGETNITGGNISGNKADNDGGGINNDGELDVKGGSISNNIAKGNGGGIDNGDSSVMNINKGDITGNEATNGGGVNNTGELNINGGNISGNTADNNGGGVNSDGELDVKGGVISGNVAGGNGGGINTEASGRADISKGDITGNEATNGGGINIGAGSEVNIHGGNITGNEAKEDGGGVNNTGELTISGGNIRDNKAGNDGGGVNNDGDLDVKGGVISGNEAGGNGGGINTEDGGVTDINKGDITGNEATNGGGINTEDGGTTNINDGNITENEAKENGGGVNNETGGTTNIKGGNITNNIAGNDGGGVNNDGDLDVNGGKISNNTATGNGGGINTGDGGVTDINKGDITGNEATNGGGINTEDGGTTNINDGNITGNTAKEDGGGVNNEDGGTTNINGGNITGNIAGNDGGGVNNDGDLDVNGGTISNNIAKGDGGGINTGDGGVTDINDGDITGNEATNGGGINTEYGGTTNINDGNITGNTAKEDGGGVNNEDGGTTNINGGNISGNIAGNNGGGVNNDGDLDVNGGDISGNTAGGNGGGINTGNGGVTDINDGNITDNTATNGGGVNTENGGTTNINGGNISENEAENNGGGVNNENGGTTNIKGGEITNNTAGGDGGGVNNDGELDVNGGHIGGNTAGGTGDAVNTGNTGNTEISGGNINGDISNEDGGDTNITGGTVTDTEFVDPDYTTDVNPDGTVSIYAKLLKITYSGRTEYIHEGNIDEFTTFARNNATYTLMKNVRLVHSLTVAQNITVTLDLHGFILKGAGNGSVISNSGKLTLTDGNSTAVHKYT